MKYNFCRAHSLARLPNGYHEKSAPNLLNKLYCGFGASAAIWIEGISHVPSARLEV